MYHNTQQSGFSLVETLVALTILLLVMIGPMSIASSTARSTSFASEQVTAFFLAQEGVEFVEKYRDELLMTEARALGSPYNTNPTNGILRHNAFWTKFTDTSGSGALNECYKNSGCALEISSANVRAAIQVINGCNPITNCRLYFRDVTALGLDFRTYYTYSTGAGYVQTPFTRQIFLTPVATDQVQVRSVVTWHSGSLHQDQTVEVETYIFNVYGN